MSDSKLDPIAVVAEIFEQEELDCVVLDEGVAVKTGMSIDDDLSWECVVEAAPLSEDVNALLMFSRPPEALPNEGHLLETLQLLNRINSQLLTVGGFEIDLDHELTMRTGLIYEDASELSVEVIAHTLFINWAEMGRYLPVIMDVAYGRRTLEECWTELYDAE